jgi:hypothetical protein
MSPRVGDRIRFADRPEETIRQIMHSDGYQALIWGDTYSVIPSAVTRDGDHWRAQYGLANDWTHTVGPLPSSVSWLTPEALRRQRRHLERVTGGRIKENPGEGCTD